MKKIISISLLLCGILFAFSCKNEANTDNNTVQKNIDYDGMAKALCECMTPLLEIQEKVAVLSAEGKTDEIQKLLKDVERLSAEGDKCVENLEAKYGSIEGENEKKANTAFQKACPKVAAMLSQAVN